ncbi:MAG: hypothetical protein NTW32_21050, partial [Chloroflexi bacterium]|nr:hypothetical protein [Chloroflexota bacterium]
SREVQQLARFNNEMVLQNQPLKPCLVVLSGFDMKLTFLCGLISCWSGQRMSFCFAASSLNLLGSAQWFIPSL